MIDSVVRSGAGAMSMRNCWAGFEIVSERSFAITTSAVLTCLVLLFGAGPIAAQENVTYEVLINGESFLVEGNRVVKVRSQEDPSVEYELAIRVAPVQRLRLLSLELEYDNLSQVNDDGGRTQRTVRIDHQLGYSVQITDLNGEMDDTAAAKAAEILESTLLKSIEARGIKSEDADVKRFAASKFAHTTARGVRISYSVDGESTAVAMGLVLRGEGTAATAIIQYPKADEEVVVSQVRGLLNSVRPLGD